MGMMKKFAYLGIAKKIYDESRKPENRRRISDAVESVRKRRGDTRRRPG